MSPSSDLVQTVDLANSPANEVFPADIDGDGRLEYLFLQSPGIYQSRLFNPGSPFWDAPYDAYGNTRRTDCCLSALDGDGRLEVVIHNLRRAWIFRPPWATPPEDPRVGRMRAVTGQGWYAQPQGHSERKGNGT